MQKKTKKGMAFSEVAITVILLITFLIVLSEVFFGISNRGQDTKDLLECQISAKGLVRDSGGLVPSSVDLIKNKCKSEKIEIEKKDFSKINELLLNCWMKTGSGNVEFLEGTDTNLGFCMHCGKISTQEDIENFNKLTLDAIRSEEDMSKIFEDGVAANLNLETISSGEYLPNSLDANSSIELFYFIYRLPPKDSLEEIGEYIRESFSEGALIRDVLDGFYDENAEVVSGMIFGNFKEAEFGEAPNEIEYSTSIGKSSIKCSDLIIPKSQD